MSNYVKAVDFAAKDGLATGNPSKIVKGTEIGAEYDAIATAVATKADTASPTFTGTPVAPTASGGTNTTQIATTAFVQSATSGTYAPLASPALTGTPTAPTASGGTNTTQLATTAFVTTAVAASQVGIQYQDEGSSLGTSGTATVVNFTGAGVTAS